MTDNKIIGATVGTGFRGAVSSVDVEPIEGGHRVTFKGAFGVKTFDVMDGKDGSDGGFTTDATLSLDPETGILSVNTADNVEQDNTLPITSAAVFETVGNIEVLLTTI